jgi:hypothetical protein
MSLTILETSRLQSLKLAMVEILGLSKDALHIHVGLAVFCLAAAICKRPFHSPIPLIAALLVALAGEVVDAYDDTRSLGYWRWAASFHDVTNTVFWPTIVFVFARFSFIWNTARGRDRL